MMVPAPGTAARSEIEVAIIPMQSRRQRPPRRPFRGIDLSLQPCGVFGREISDLSLWKIARCRRMILGGFCSPRLVEDLGNMHVILGQAQAMVEDSGHNRSVGAEHDPDA